MRRTNHFKHFISADAIRVFTRLVLASVVLAVIGGYCTKHAEAQSGYITTYAGTGSFGYLGDNGPAIKAVMSDPSGVATDAAGNIYFSDHSNSVIRMVNASTGIITTVAGIPNPGYSGNGGAAILAQLNYPTGVAVDKNGNLYISDYNNCMIRKVDAKTKVITTVAGTTSCGFYGDGKPATGALLNYPGNLAIDNSGNLYIADVLNNVIRMLNPSTGIITTVAGIAKQGFAGDGGPATAAQLNQPWGVAVDGSGNLYIADWGNRRIRKVNAATKNITTVAGNGTLGAGGSGVPATSVGLNSPISLAVDGLGDFYFSDQYSHAIFKVSSSTGTMTLAAGNRTKGYGGDGGPAINASFWAPQGIALDAAGNCFIADAGNYRIRKVQTLAPGLVTAVPLFSPKAGLYSSAQSVTITSATAGAAIYYTTDGSTPTTSSTRYTAAINVPATLTIKAIAKAAGYHASIVASATYTIEPPVAAPVFTPQAGIYGVVQKVRITDSTAGSTIYYTLNGATPTTSSTQYTGPITLGKSTTVKALAVAPDHVNSTVVTSAYVIVGSPAALAYPATAIATSTATLNGLANGLGTAVTVWFEYGTSRTAMTSATPKTKLPAGTTLQQFSAALTGLSSKTTYYFRPVASTAGGVDRGTTTAFTTN